jgi:hypothetical protein
VEINGKYPYELRGQTDKLIGNFYGKCGENLGKHKKTFYCTEFKKDLMALKNDFVEAKPFGDTFCVSRRKRRVVWNRAIQVATAVYNLAKLNYLMFVYECIDLVPLYPDGGRRVEVCYGDTDSCWIASTEEIGELHKHFPDKSWFPSKSEETVTEIEGHPISKRQFESKKPLLWKEEYTGHVGIWVKSKSYYADGPDGPKMSCKGAMKHIVEEKKNLKQDFMDMIFTREDKATVSCVNRGFKFDGKGMTSYEQQRAFLSYWYDKSIVLEDQCHLEITPL